MSLYKNNREALSAMNVWITKQDYPSTLTETEILDPFSVFHNFFSHYSLPEAKKYLWTITKRTASDEPSASADFRFILYRFVSKLQNLIDAAWLLSNNRQLWANGQSDRKSEIYLQELMDLGVISFLTQPELKNHKLVLHRFFNTYALSRWKGHCISHLKQVILDPQYYRVYPSLTLTSFQWFSSIAALLEVLFLIKKENESRYEGVQDPQVDKSARIDEDPVVWLKRYIAHNGHYAIPQSLAFIVYINRYHQEWNSALIANLYNAYECLLKLSHAAAQLLQDKQETSTAQPTKNEIKLWPIGKYIRFFTDLILTSRTFNNTYRKYVAPQKGIDHVLKLIQLVDNHLKQTP